MLFKSQSQESTKSPTKLVFVLNSHP